MKILILLISLFWSITILPSERFETIYQGTNSKVVFTTSGILSKNDLDEFGKQICTGARFCLIWFYPNLEDAKAGAEVMKKDMFGESKSLYAIFSKNKVDNEIICYRPKKGC